MKKVMRALQWPSRRMRFLAAPSVPRPIKEDARVVITGLGPGGLKGPGKVAPELFFPPFCRVLSERGVRTVFAMSPRALAKAIKSPCCIIHVYREVSVSLDHKAVLDAQSRADLVFNHPNLGRLIARKDESNRFLSAQGISMPSTELDGGVVFSNAMQESGADVQLLDDRDEIDPERYNTDFIDNRVEFGGHAYHTTIRLICVGREVVHGYVRARDVDEGSPSVHARNTPQDPELIVHLQHQLVDSRMAALEDFAESLADALGPGFYAHDILVERGSGKLFLCETGLKFHDRAYAARLAPIAHELPCHGLMFSSELAEKSARCFLSEFDRLMSSSGQGGGDPQFS